jgi:long-chain acyl-CoA synthetase
VPDFGFLKDWCTKHEIKYTTNEEMLNTKEVKDRLTKEVQKINANFGDTEKVKRFKFIADEWSTANGILTPTLKVKRSVILDRYKDVIARMYQGGD